jgi:predicted AlkP superfamily phosphohydrolase/phosphomutase
MSAEVSPPMPSPTRVLFVGLDAMDLDIARDLAARGRMPTLASLLETGGWAETQNPTGLFVGGLWPSFSTGSWPARHGFFCFLQQIPGTYEVARFDQRDIHLAPFWKALYDHGLRCAVVDVPITPVAGRTADIHIADWATHDRMRPFEASPPELHSDIPHRFGRPAVTGKCDDYAARGAYRQLRDDLVAGVEAKTRLSEELLSQGLWDLFITVFGESHCVGHHFWHLHDSSNPAHAPELAAQLGDPIEDVYAALDTGLGRLLSRVGDDTIVFVLLSHGMGPHYDGNHLLAEVLRRIEDADGRTPRAVAVRERARRYARRARRWRHANVRPELTSVDGSRRFFRIPNNDTFGGLRVNLVGREPHGRVRQGPELDALIEQLREDLLALTNTATGRPVVTQVVRTSEVYSRDALDVLPDLLVEWSREAPIAEVWSPKTGTVTGQPGALRTGDHRQQGLVLARGPSITPGRLSHPVPVTDLAPTIAAALGTALPGIDGKPIPSLTTALTTGA